MNKVIGIVGSRRRDSHEDFNKCFAAFGKIYQEGDRIVSGGCPKGADRFAEIIAARVQVPILIHYAKWNILGKRAGFVRNGDIAKDCDVLIAVIAPDRTGGAEDTIKKARKLGKRIILVK